MNESLKNIGSFLEKTASTTLETEFGMFQMIVYREKSTGKEHIALLKEWGEKTPFVRLHSECATGDIFSSTFCDCGKQLHKAMEIIQQEGGVLVYLRQEGRGLGLTQKIQAYELQRNGMDTVEANISLGREADERDYTMAADILRDLNISSLKLLSNNPRKLEALHSFGFKCEQVLLQIDLLTERGKKYIRTKREKMGHTL
jgi:3,4-dihydroxy 2-butanone 4-phosphate synthase/GTP cyclohydrolase II